MRAAPLLAAFLLAGSAPAAAGLSQARLAIGSREPLSVVGTHFLPRERILVTASSAASVTVGVRADASGTFRVQFPSLSSDRCNGLSVRAAGTRGSVAALKLPLPGCLPARNP